MQVAIYIWISFFATEHNLDPILIEAIVRSEAGFKKDGKTYNPDAIGKIGEIGLMQMRHEYLEEPTRYLNPYENLKEGTKRLVELKRLENTLGAFWFTAWNAGASGALEYHKKFGISKHKYSKKVLSNYIAIKKEMKKRPLEHRYEFLGYVHKKNNFNLIVQAD